ncbi:MAG TPA: hypothetical protein VMU16_12085 [Candidatus Binataceae bacterium]|nr:hypothetical protein [Candidatus Binataceae bacterium]
MKYELAPYHRNAPDEELLADLRRVAAEIGKSSITRDEYDERGRFSSSTLTRRFGSWFAATDKVGLDRTRNLTITNEELLSNLAELWARLGRQPRYGNLNAETSKFSAGTYENRFGTWRKALEAFVKWANESEPTPAPEKNAVSPPMASEPLEKEPARAVDKGTKSARRTTAQSEIEGACPYA